MGATSLSLREETAGITAYYYDSIGPYQCFSPLSVTPLQIPKTPKHNGGRHAKQQNTKTQNTETKEHVRNAETRVFSLVV